jgi:hypothetical protein
MNPLVDANSVEHYPLRFMYASYPGDVNSSLMVNQSNLELSGFGRSLAMDSSFLWSVLFQIEVNRGQKNLRSLPSV